MTWMNSEGQEIRIDGVERKVYEVQGRVVKIEGFNEEITIAPITSSSRMGGKITSYTTGYQKRLHIEIEASGKNFPFTFKGNSPLRGGDKVKAGLFLEQGEPMQSALYLEIIGNADSWRRDYMDGYNPTRSECEKLGLETKTTSLE